MSGSGITGTRLDPILASVRERSAERRAFKSLADLPGRLLTP